MTQEKRLHPVKRAGVESSTIHSAGYCEQCGSGYIAFKAKGDDLVLYVYPQAEKDTFDKLLAAESKGKYFQAEMRKLKAKRLAAYHG